MIASRRRGQVLSLTTVLLWLLLMLVAQAHALRGIGLLLAASFHDEHDQSDMDAGRRGLISSVQASTTTSSSLSASSSSSLSSSTAAAAAAAGKAQAHGAAGAGGHSGHRPAPPAAAYHEHTHPSSPAAEKDSSFNQLDPGSSPGHIDCPPLNDASSSSSSSSEDELVDCNSPSPEGEIDPRYGVEKRFVPTGPNPLHN